MIALLLLSMLAFPISAQATVFWDDELEVGDTGYSLPGEPGAMTFDTSVKYSGNGSLRYNFPSVCWPDASAQLNCSGITDRNFTLTQTLFRRVYIKASVGFHWADTYTKLFRSDTDDNNYSNWWTVGCCETSEMNVHNQNQPTFGDTTRYDSGYFGIADGNWHCVETQETLSTAGVADGISRLWVDGVQYLNVTNLQSRASGQTQLFYNNRMYRQIGEGNIWFDRLAVGDTRIGCLAGGGSGGGPIVMFITQAAIVTSAFLQVIFISGYFWERRKVAVQAAVKFWRYAAEVPTPKEMYWMYRYKKAVKRWQKQAPLMLEHQPMDMLELPKQQERSERPWP